MSKNITVKVMTFKKDDDPEKIFEKNLLAYIELLDEKLKTILKKGYFIDKTYDKSNLSNTEGHVYYFITINSEELKTRSYYDIKNGPFDYLYNLDGVLNVTLENNGVKLICPGAFFIQENFFESLKTIKKFSL